MPLRFPAVLATVGVGGCPPPPPDVPLRATPSPRPERRRPVSPPPPDGPLRGPRPARYDFFERTALDQSDKRGLRGVASPNQAQFGVASLRLRECEAECGRGGGLLHSAISELAGHP